MEIIVHQCNTSIKLLETDNKYGIEVDIRSSGNDLIISHDPFVQGEIFDDWIKLYKHGTLILNVKEEGLEERLTLIMKENKINHYFFLDQSFPFLIKSSKLGINKCAVRISEYESIETALSLPCKVDWVWVDCFTRFQLSKNDSIKLKNSGFKICIVSPELQGRKSKNEIFKIKQILNEKLINVDAVCTKYPIYWESF